jgi:tetratricopeptide (TPR) repeat protein
MPPKGPGSLPRLFAHDNALNPVFGRAARDHAVGNDLLDVKNNKATVSTPADAIPEVADAHAKAWAAFDRQDFDDAVTWFKRAITAAERYGLVAYKSENTLGLVHTAMADWDAALRQTSHMKRVLEDADPAIRQRFRMALHTNRGAVYSRMASRVQDAARNARFLHLSYREHFRAAAMCGPASGKVDTERAWNMADAACRLSRWDEAASILNEYLPKNPQLTELIHTNSRQDEWPTFLSLYHEHGGRFIPANPEGYRVIHK